MNRYIYKKLSIILILVISIALLAFLALSSRKGKKTMTSHKSASNEHPNRLIHEKSPYLQQHAHNPVDWYPWGKEAFGKAESEDKLILLSIGYSACHWCHVMAHESFENDSVAKIMNENFINIKVDREEYPDVDHLYQTFVQMTRGQGGWPLTVFLTPQKVPVYGGTYFPIKSRYGMISFPELLRGIIELKENDPEKITKSSQEILAIIKNLNQIEKSDRLPDPATVLNTLYRTLQQRFDGNHGGFGKAPKFPHVADIDFLLNFYHHTGEDNARHMALFTLRKMAEGGIYDQAGGGFHRYSTDERWLVPHFEKMLYDNALLIPVYADAFRLTADPFYRRIVTETADFVLDELTDPNGGFFSTLDADSEGEEGKYYVWEYEEITKFLDKDIFTIFTEYYNITPGGNFEGKNILNVKRPLDQIAQNHGMKPETARQRILQVLEKLQDVRSHRIRPGLDDKILADWNGMMISALWDAHQISGEQRYREAAVKAIDYLYANYFKNSTRLLHFIKNKGESVPGYLDDYAYVIQALLDGFETIQNEEYLSSAIALAQSALQIFRDEKRGGFYFTGSDADTTLARLRQQYDASTPAGNNIMALNLLRLFAYTGEELFFTSAQEIFRLMKSDLEKRPSALSSLARAFSLFHYSPLELTLSIPKIHSKKLNLSEIHQLFAPDRILVKVWEGKQPEQINPDLIRNRQINDHPAVFVCYKGTCSLPMHSIEEVKKTIGEFGLVIE